MAVQISGNDITVPRDTTVTRNLTVGGVLTYEDVTNVDSIGIVTARAGVLVGSGITLSKDGDIFATGVTTSTTFVGALTGNVTGNISGGTVAGSTGTFTGDVDIADKIVHTGDTDTLIRFPSADNIQFDVAGVERLRIDNSDGVIAKHTTAANLRVQNSTAASSQTATLDMAPANGLSGVQLKCTSEEDFSTGANRTAFFTIENRKDGTFYERLRIHSGGQVQIAGDSIASISSFADDLIIGESGSSAINGITLCSTDSSGIRFHDTGDVGEIEFNHSDNSLTVSMDGLLKVRTNSAERLRIDSSGNLDIKTGDIFFSTAGKGIVLGATSNTDANTLDDYEEGTFTFTNASGSNVAVNTSNRYGFYIKVGRSVHVWGQFSTDTTGNYAVGTNIRIHDLPFVTDSSNTPNATGVITVNYQTTHQTTVGVVHISGTDELHGRVTQTSGHSITGSGHYFHVSYVTAS